jgi:hypothetical protein
MGNQLTDLVKFGLLKHMPGRWVHFSLRFAYACRFSRWCSEHPGAEIPHRPDLRGPDSKRCGLFEFLFETQHLDTQIDYLEFGVASGESFRWWVEHNGHPLSRFFGFDTFTGLPEDWDGLPQGAFSTGGHAPDIADPRCSFRAGLFQDTLRPFLDGYTARCRKVVHLDADLYSSTLFVLSCLGGKLNPGDILIFDEFGGILDEFRAFLDVSSAYRLNLQLLGGANRFYHAAFLVV